MTYEKIVYRGALIQAKHDGKRSTYNVDFKKKYHPRTLYGAVFGTIADAMGYVDRKVREDEQDGADLARPAAPDGVERCKCGKDVQAFRMGDGSRRFMAHYAEYPQFCNGAPAQIEMAVYGGVR